MKCYLKNERGSGLVGVVIVLTLVSFMGAALIDSSSVDSVSTSNGLQSVQALQIGNGAFQEATYKINQGQSPNATNKPFGQGNYTTTTDPASQNVTVTSIVGPAKSVQSMSVPFSQQCITLDVTGAYQQGQYLKGLELTKTCNAKATLTKMKIEWNWGACATTQACTGTTGTATVNPDPSVGKQSVCHIPPNNPAGQHTISVGAATLSAHLAHGDTLGACPSGDTSTALVCEGYDTQIQACGPADLGATVKKIIVNGTTIADDISATSGSIIDTSDITLTNNATYPIDQIKFDQNPPDGAWYAVTVYFADGSEIRKPFKFGSSATADSGGTNPSYSVVGGVVTVVANKTVKIDALGSVITCDTNSKTIQVRVDLGGNNSYSAIFNNKPINGGESYTTGTGATSVAYKIRGSAGLTACHNFSSTHDSTDSTYVKTLVNGQQAPPLLGYGGQKPIQSFLAPYLTSQGVVVLNSNQVIMLFELGVGEDPNTTAASFQDLVMLFTIN